jgi:hypothetical protein
VRFAALLVALVSIGIGIVGLVSPDSVMNVRREYLATGLGLRAAGAVRMAMGLVLITFARSSRAPKMLRVIGAVMCLQGFVSQFYSVSRAQALVEWEATLGATLLRVGAFVALATGVFVAFAADGGGRRFLGRAGRGSRD